MDVNPLLQAGGVAGMFGICVFLVVALFRATNGQQRTLVDQQRALLRQNRELNREHQWCTRRLNMVIVELDRHGIRVPDEVWIDAPMPPTEGPGNA